MLQALKRRTLLQAGGAVALTGLAQSRSEAQAAAPSVKIAALKDVRPGEPVNFSYPGEQPAVLIDVGHKVEHGVGPHESVVAYSALCQHMGCPVGYDAQNGNLKCPCHGSQFDPRRDGMAVRGPAPQGLPRIALKVSGDGSIHAVGIAEGIVYGYACSR